MSRQKESIIQSIKDKHQFNLQLNLSTLQQTFGNQPLYSLIMLSDNSPADALLSHYKPSPQFAQSKKEIVSDQIQPPKKTQPKIQESQSKAPPKTKPKKDTSPTAEKRFTMVLKIFNIVLGILLTAFGVYCYYGVKDQDLSNFKLIGYIMPGYLAFSGLVIIAIEMHIAIICRNMKFLYNYFGRGFFNIYVGIMPLTLLEQKDNTKKTQSELIQTVAIYILVSLLVFIGLLYIVAKICCCAKEGDKTKKQKKRKNNSQSNSSQSDD